MKLVIVGPSPSSDVNQHAGGQLTAVRLLKKVLDEQNTCYKIVDTSKNNFPKPNFFIQIIKSLKNMLFYFYLIIFYRPRGCIIFASSGYSFFEKSLYALISRTFRVNTILSVRSGHFIDECQHSKINSIRNIFLKFPNIIIAQGTDWKRFYSEKFGLSSNVVIIPNWVDIEESNGVETRSFIGKDNEFIKVLFCGWMVEKKGVLDLLDVAIKLSNKNIQFIFAGGGTLYDFTKEKVKSLGLSDSIKILGWQSKEQLDVLYNDADIFVLPSYAEGFPNAVLEAMSFKLPIIATKVGAIPDSVIDNLNGFCITPGDSEQLEQKVLFLSSSKLVRLKFGQKSYELLKQNHDLYKNISKLLVLFE
ncbi:glycosyltransferase family 4 protein [Francisella sp. LA112445]|uniref:glycosyltransferase family 4 protein n=1 Tax=Francisella sp. LA112445 TaxID=1395624 RepID=UPI001788C869|nr:glycosyltransferase family 4 protein [Francisella sp. LA112445]